MSSLRSALPAAVALACLAALVPLQNAIDRSDQKPNAVEEILYFADGEALARLSLGYESLLADVYWMRAVQFFGRKVIDQPDVLSRRSEELALLYPMIDVTTTLDPRFVEPYRFGGYFVHDYVDAKQGIALLEKAVRNNPDKITLYQDLAYLHWTDGNCARASELYGIASAKPDAPYWMKDLAATILADCGDYRVTIQMLTQLYDTTEDPRLREEVLAKLESFVALDEVLYLGRGAAAHHARTGQWPASLPAVARAAQALGEPSAPRLRLDRTGVPLDPRGVPYRYDPATGTIQPDPRSVVLPQSARRPLS